MEFIQNSTDKTHDFNTTRRPASQDFTLYLHFENSTHYGQILRRTEQNLLIEKETALSHQNRSFAYAI